MGDVATASGTGVVAAAGGVAAAGAAWASFAASAVHPAASCLATLCMSELFLTAANFFAGSRIPAEAACALGLVTPVAAPRAEPAALPIPFTTSKTPSSARRLRLSS